MNETSHARSTQGKVTSEARHWGKASGASPKYMGRDSPTCSPSPLVHARAPRRRNRRSASKAQDKAPTVATLQSILGLTKALNEAGVN